MNLSSIDLNLLVVLHEVLTRKSATLAAKQLGVTQSAVSNALARLRERLADPLVVRNGRGLALTPRARALLPKLGEILSELGHLIADDTQFDAATTHREFTLACADYYGMVVLPRLAATLKQRAPHARLRLVPLEQLGPSSGESASARGLAHDVDLHVGRPPTLSPGCRAVPLFHEDFVCLTRPNRRRATSRMTMSEYRHASHVRVRVLDSARDPIDVALAKRGIVRSIAVTVPHFSLAPLVVAELGYVATIASRLAHLYAKLMPVEVRAAPIRLGSHPVKMIWHERTESDEGARFFRDLVTEVSGPSSDARPVGLR